MSARSRRRLLAQVALAPPDQARAAWRAVAGQVDLDAEHIENMDLLPTVAYRLGELVDDDPLLPVLQGLRRKTWYTNQLVLDRLAREIEEGRRPPSPLAVGHLATILAFAPGPEVLRVEEPDLRDGPGAPAVEVEVHGLAVRVPVAADHVLYVLLRDWWVDAALGARHPTMDWERLADEAIRRGLRWRVRRRLVALRRMAGPDVVPDAVLDRLRPGPGGFLREAVPALGPAVRRRLSHRA